MTTTEFIEKALAGGWVCKNEWGSNPYDMPFERILLDKFAWQAVGKVEGWEGEQIRMCVGCGVALKGNEKPTMDGKHGGKHGCGSDIYEYGGQWLIEMHKMVDYLAESKTTEEFLATLD
jgi:hypothetical protein